VWYPRYSTDAPIFGIDFLAFGPKKVPPRRATPTPILHHAERTHASIYAKHRERERERESDNTHTHTNTHKHTLMHMRTLPLEDEPEREGL
jgi:hypothetical protein